MHRALKKKVFLIEGIINSNSVFETMSCFSEYSMLSPCTESNYAFATSYQL